MIEENLYIIRKGDTFWGLENEWGLPHGILQTLNPNVDPRRLQIGQQIEIVMPTLVYLIAEKIPEPQYTPYEQMYITQSTFESYIDSLSQNSYFSPDNYTYQEPKTLEKEQNHKIEETIRCLGLGKDILSLENIRRTKLLTSNELWHLQKNGVITHPWKQMSNGASHWKNNLVQNHRLASQTALKSRAIAGSVLRKAGPALLIADIGLSGEVKPSHVVTAVLIGASSTGIGAIFAGIYFIADIGTGVVTGRSISDRLDGWAEDNLGKLELYEGVY